MVPTGSSLYIAPGGGEYSQTLDQVSAAPLVRFDALRTQGTHGTPDDTVQPPPSTCVRRWQTIQRDCRRQLECVGGRRTYVWTL